ncbi:uncharacterized protein EI97DRAFT_489984 [Westerdykella ornata]|uniref:Uncharacterized protein n=1 Tax=Westerdykella ornata TaxID=318751 RepID=A0A6A6J524_WESOR|nr:uncharacterized protein EI97DRAFT_489984 [Westerdykella ornata]KAF2271223.1 hypothetical protein EI97DRAFT_489984 [Westerdykella ornata]
MDRDKWRKKKEEKKQQEEIAISSTCSSSSSESEDLDIEMGENNSPKVVIRAATKPTSSLAASSFASTSNLASFASSTPSTQKRDHLDLSPEKPRPKHIAIVAKEQLFTLVQSKAAKRKEEKELFLKRKLVLVTSKEDEGQEIGSLSLRNKINYCLLAVSTAKKPLVAAVSRSRDKQNIVLTTTEDYNADFLIKHKEKWQNLFRFNREQRVETWAQIVAYGVPLALNF